MDILRVSIVIFMTKQKENSRAFPDIMDAGDIFGSAVGNHVRSVDDV